MLAPRAQGGEQVALDTALAVTEELARQDGSVGWNATFAFLSPLFGDYLPAATSQAIFGRHDAIVAANFVPRGRATRVAGGYRLEGRWSFMSGCKDATWIVVGGLVVAGEQPEVGPDGTPAARLFTFPACRGEILDTWRTTGMRGTGSHDYAVAGCVVPADRSFPVHHLARGPEPRAGQAYPQPFFAIAPLFLAAVGLGVAQAALEGFVTLAAEKTPVGATTALAAQALAQERVGRAQALLGAARCYLLDAARTVMAGTAAAPAVPTLARLAAAHAADCATEAVTLLHQAAGGSSIYETCRLERCFRDIHTLTHHFQLGNGAFVAAGERLLAQGRSLP
jgi:alkylation response protein AidB-like acyl-CoA dehydrogenase